MSGETGKVQNPMRIFTTVVWVLIATASLFAAVTGGSTLRQLASGCFALFFASLAYRAYRSCLSWSAEGVTAKDDMRMKSFYPWSEIDRFEQRGLRGIGAVMGNGQWGSTDVLLDSPRHI